MAVTGLERTENRNNFQQTNEFSLPLTHKDLNLGYFEYIQRRIDTLTSGEKIFITEEGCTNSKGDLILKYSKNFRETLTQIKETGFHPSEAHVNYIVYWKNKETGNEVKIVLGELVFTRDVE